MTTHEPDPPEVYFSAIDETWPAAETYQTERFTSRRGAGGGMRVSATSFKRNWQPEDIEHAVDTTRKWGQDAIFAIRSSQCGLDSELDQRGYEKCFETLILTAATTQLQGQIKQDEVDTCSDILLQIQRDIWISGRHVTAPRWQVMERVTKPKTYLLGRHDNSPCATGFAAISGSIAMLHALEVHTEARRHGLGARLTAKAAAWAEKLGARQLALLVTSDNQPALSMYQGLGMEVIGKYHYRVQKKKEPSRVE